MTHQTHYNLHTVLIALLRTPPLYSTVPLGEQKGKLCQNTLQNLTLTTGFTTALEILGLRTSQVWRFWDFPVHSSVSGSLLFWPTVRKEYRCISMSYSYSTLALKPLEPLAVRTVHLWLCGYTTIVKFGDNCGKGHVFSQKKNWETCCQKNNLSKTRKLIVKAGVDLATSYSQVVGESNQEKVTRYYITQIIVLWY